MKLAEGFDKSAVLDELRRRYGSERLRHVVVPRLISDETAAELRAAADTAGFSRYELADRGRFEENRARVDENLFATLREFASLIAERPLTVGAARWLRLQRGDYALIKHDARDRLHEARHLEALLDFSERDTDQAEIIFTDGTDSWPLPQLSGSLSLVDRPPSVFRYERYLSLHVGDAVVYRLRLSLPFA